MEGLAALPWYGWAVVFSALVMAFVVLMTRKVKGVFGDKTIEVDGDDGEKQQTDTFGLMYILNDSCRQIEQRKKETIDGIIPDLSYRLADISSVSCVSFKAESILHARRRRNGFEKLITARLFDDYVADVADEIERKTQAERVKVFSCSPQANSEVHPESIREIARVFTAKAVSACVTEYRDKAEMYRRFRPQFELLNDKQRVAFCDQKIRKHEARIRDVEAVLSMVEVAA